jgi:nitrite reductase/ring-hydroxylating ferredoxin subunit
MAPCSKGPNRRLVCAAQRCVHCRYAVHPVESLPEDRPFAIAVLGRALAIWKDGSGTWRAFDDSCPHRKVAFMHALHECLRRVAVVTQQCRCEYPAAALSAVGLRQHSSTAWCMSARLGWRCMPFMMRTRHACTLVAVRVRACMMRALHGGHPAR